MRYLASFEKEIILSTAMATLEEVGFAVEEIQKTSKAALTLLHCTTSYPCPFDEVNLLALKTLEQKFSVPVGYSDHTMGAEVALAARALGACVLEKHFTLDRNMPGPDHLCSLEPAELKKLVRSVRNVEIAFGSSEKKPTAAEEALKSNVRRSLVLARDLQEGAILGEDDFIDKRAGDGIPPYEISKLVGKKLCTQKRVDELIEWKDVCGE